VHSRLVCVEASGERIEDSVQESGDLNLGLALHDPVKVKLVEMRFFVGLPGDLAHHGGPGLVIRPRLAVRRHGRRRSRRKI
jgi:hypothetical protein